MACRVVALLVLAAMVPCWGFGGEPLPEWWVKMPKPGELISVGELHGMPPLHEGDPGGERGPAAFLVQSVSGLLALKARETGEGPLMWVGLEGNPSYRAWRAHLSGAGIAMPQPGAASADPRGDLGRLVQKLHGEGLIKGYILYRADPSKRQAFDAAPAPGAAGYNNSVNVATSLAGPMGAVIIEEKAEPFLRDLGLPLLLDARDRDERWCFENHRDKFSRKLVHVIDPKVPHLRDYAIATGSLVVFGVSPFTDEVYRWMEPDTPVMGWNGGDEHVMTSQLTRFAHFHTASNWCMNLPATGSLRAGTDLSWERLRLNRRSGVEPLELDWPVDTHFTSFVTTDGDNVQWAMGDYIHNGSYWRAPGRGRFPMGWSFPAEQLAQIAPMALAELAATQSPNDQMISFGGGYYYPDEYGQDAEGDRFAHLERKVDQFAPYFEKLGIRMLIVLTMDWKGDAARRAYEIYAKRIPGLAGVMVLQYYPYNAGQGGVIWVENAKGDPLPVVSARYALWNNMSKTENNGPPALLARLINESKHAGHPVSEAHIDWVTAHTWSFFKKADTAKDILAEEVEQEKAARDPEARRGFEPVGWCVDRLAPHVRVVTPEETVWRLRLHMRPKETLRALARDLAERGDTPPTMKEGLDKYLDHLAGADLSTPERARAAFEQLKAVRYGGETVFPELPAKMDAAWREK